jgi:hypothetical protein
VLSKHSREGSAPWSNLDYGRVSNITQGFDDPSRRICVYEEVLPQLRFTQRGCLTASSVDLLLSGH